MLTPLCLACLSACWHAPLPSATQYVYSSVIPFNREGISEDILVPPWVVDVILFTGGETEAWSYLVGEDHTGDRCVKDGV